MATGITYAAASDAASAGSAAVLRALVAAGVPRDDAIAFAARVVNFIMQATDAYAEDDAPEYDPDNGPDIDRADIPVADWRDYDSQNQEDDNGETY